jgi:hypothetical protein
MKHTKLFFILTLAAQLTACGGGDQPQPNQRITGCDSGVVAVMATMGAPNLMGMGEPDTTTYSTSGQNHVLIYEFVLAKTTYLFEYNANYCRMTVTTH